MWMTQRRRYFKRRLALSSRVRHTQQLIVAGEQHRERPPEDQASPNKLAPPAAVRIVLIDDSEVVRAWAREELATQGFEVLTYGEAFGIQNFVRQSAPAVVLLDLKMPALQGDMVCRLLKQHKSTRDVIVALYSSLPEAELKVIANACLADGYIVKDNDPKELARQIRALLASRQG